MSDPTNPYGNQPGAQPPYGSQPGAQPPYGQPGAQPPYGSQPGGQASYGSQPGTQPPSGQSYGQPAYGQPMYSINPAVERVRSNASTVRIMGFVSLLILGPFLSVPAWIWGNSLMNEARSLGAPADVMNDLRGARTTAMVCAIIELAGFILIFLLAFLGALLDS